jgi:hypothetical protein
MGFRGQCWKNLGVVLAAVAKNVFMFYRSVFTIVTTASLAFPNEGSKPISGSENFVERHPQSSYFVIIDGHHENAVLPQQIPCELEALIHHRQPI